MSISVAEVVKLTGVRRQAVYKAIRAGRLTEITSLGKKGVKEDQKLKDFLAIERVERDGKRKKR